MKSMTHFLEHTAGARLNSLGNSQKLHNTIIIISHNLGFRFNYCAAAYARLRYKYCYCAFSSLILLSMKCLINRSTLFVMLL